MSQFFVLKFALKTPIALTYLTTLDGLLSSRIFEESQDIDVAHERIPLERHGRVWAGSSMFLEAPALVAPASVGSSFRRAMMNPPPMKPGPRGRYRAVMVGSGPFRNRVTEITTYSTPAVYFLGQGDSLEVRRLCSGMTAMGKKRSAGFGEVDPEAFSFVSAKPTRAHPALMLADGSPARPIPLDEWSGLGGDPSVPIAHVRCLPPYFRGEAIRCVVPAHTQIRPDLLRTLFL